MNIASLLQRSALHYPDRPALFRGSHPLLDYRGLGLSCQRAAAWLHALGLQPGDRVAIYMANSPDYLVSMLGALWAGLCIVPINAKLHPKEAAYIVEHSGSRLLITAEEQVPEVLRIGGVRHASARQAGQAASGHDSPLTMVHRRPEDLAWLFYTSGTTGRPKGVMLSHRNLLAMTLSYQADVESVESDDAVVYAAPMSHGAGLYAFAYLNAAARHVVPASGGFDGQELADLATTIGRLCLFAAPTMVRRLVQELAALGRDGRGFKTIVYGGGPMYVADLIEARRVMGARFVQIYGQGESPMTITVLPRSIIEDEQHPAWMSRLASVGFRHSAVEVQVVDEHDRPMACGQVGEVVVRGDTVMQGYWNNPQASESTLRAGWLHTGDLGVLDAYGFLTLKDRSKDLVISGGSNIYPREVEEVLVQHPQVLEAAVIGVADPEWGEVVVAFVVPRNTGQDLSQELDALCLAELARFKRPKRYLFVEALPKNHYGKVLKTELRQHSALAAR